MLDTNLKQQLSDYFKKLNRTVTLRQCDGQQTKTAELTDLLKNISELSDFIEYEIITSVNTEHNDGLTFYINNSRVLFRGIPGGHEFSSLILAILQAGGHPPKLDESIQNFIKTIDEPLHFETIVSLDCHNCPEVVQALNAFALLNQNITHSMIDGALYTDLVNSRNVQGVPAVFLNEKSFANGKIDAASLVEKLMSKGLKQIKEESSYSGAANDVFDVAVIGAGPAGVAAAVYSARKGLKVTMIADRLGGQVKDTMGIENLISVPATTGPQLSNILLKQVEDHKITMRQHLRVDSLHVPERPEIPREIKLNTGDSIYAKTIIIATGARWRELGVPGEKENLGKGVAYCPHCDGPFFKDKTVAVIGGGNSGVEAALDLSGIVKQVHVLEFMDELKADQILIDRLQSTKNISVRKSVKTNEILSDGKHVHALIYTDRASESRHELPLDGVFVQIGLVPNSQFAKDTLEMNRFGEIIVNDRCETSAPGIFACGDVTTVPYKQIIVAMGEGAKASLSAFDYLLKLPVNQAA